MKQTSNLTISEVTGIINACQSHAEQFGVIPLTVTCDLQVYNRYDIDEAINANVSRLRPSTHYNLIKVIASS